MSDLIPATPASAIAQAKSNQANNTQKNASIREAAEQFEALFLTQILNSMTSGVEVDGMFGGGPSEGIYRSMLNDEYAKSVSRQGGVGIADVVYREMLALQEIS